MKTQAVNFLVEYLANLGVTHIFGIPGGPLTPFYMAVYNARKIEPILTKHELGAAFMADGYARVRGGIGVCCGTTGPGSTNLITGVASAYADSVPLLVLTGQVATKAFGKGASQESTEETVDIVEMFRKITRYSALVMRGDKLPEMLHRAMSHALGGRTGPVHLNIPCDTMFHEVEYGFAQLRTPIVRTRTFDRESIKQAVVALLRASRPGVLLGHGTVLSDACCEARLIAEMLSIPVATTPKAKGAFPEDHKLSLGVFGFSGHPAAEKYLLENGLDVLLAVGTSFNEWGSLSWDRRLQPKESLLHVDIDPAQIGRNYPSKVPLIGDAKAVLTELYFEIKRNLKWMEFNPETLLEEVAALKAKAGPVLDEEKMRSTDVPLKPARLMKDLRDSLPQDAIVFVDGGANRSWATHYFRTYHPKTFFSATGFASMGYGVAAPIGAKFAAPDRVVVAIVGDGGMLMNGMEVSTAVQYERPVIWVIMNDGQMGMIYHGRRMSGLSAEGVEYSKVDFVKVAEGLGARGIRITEPGQINRTLMAEIIESGQPTVLDVAIDREEVPPIGARIRTLRRSYKE